MALPATLNKDAPAGSDSPATIDNDIRAFKLWVEDVFGVADDVAVAAALGSITADGLQYWTLQDTSGNPAAAGRLQRNSTALLFHDGTAARTLVTDVNTVTLTNKTLTAPVIATISNSGTITIPTGTDTLVGKATTDTLTNKTLTAPVIATISNTGTLTLPTATDTLVGKATTDTLSNKTLTTPTIASFTNAQHTHANAAGGGGLTSPTIATQITLDHTNDYTLTWANPSAARAISLEDPGGTDIFVWKAATQTLTNKTLTSPTLGGTITGAASSVYVPAAVVGTAVAHGLYRDNVNKGWASISYSGGTPTRDASFNSSGIVDDGPGLITITWGRDFSDANYAVVATAGHATAPRSATVISRAAGNVKIRVTDGAGNDADPTLLTVIAFGAQ